MPTPTTSSEFERLLAQRHFDALLERLAFVAARIGDRCPPDRPGAAPWLDALLERAVRGAFGGAVAPRPLDDATTLYLVNHPAALETLRRLVAMQAIGRPLVVATVAGPGGRWDPVADEFERFEVLDGTIPARIAALLASHARHRPGRTLLLGPAPDLVALGAALLQPLEHRWAVVHDAAHHVGLGSSIPGLRHVDLDAGRHAACRTAGIDGAIYVPPIVLPVPPRTNASWPPVAATIGAADQFLDGGNAGGYADFLAAVLPHVAAFHHFGALPDKAARMLRGRLARFSNFHLHPAVDSLAGARAEVELDAYFEPPRHAPTRIALDAMVRGIPVFCRQRPARPDDSVATLGGHLVTWRDKHELATIFAALDAERLLQRGREARDAVLRLGDPGEVAATLGGLVQRVDPPQPAEPESAPAEAATTPESIGGDFDAAAKDLDILGELTPAPERADAIYQAWLAQRALAPTPAPAIDPPCFGIVVTATRAEFPRLADTVDSLGRQLDANWRLVVLSEEPAPDPIFSGSRRFVWLQAPGAGVEPTRASLVAAIAAHFECDWIAALPAGSQVAEGAFAQLARHLARHPAHRVVYTNHDEAVGLGARRAPVFKPRFNLDLLRSGDYVRAAVFFQRSALAAAGGFGALAETTHFDALLRCHDAFGADAIGHVDEMLVSLPAVAARPAIAFEPLRDAVRAHLARRAIAADVVPGPVPGTCRVAYARTNRASVSVVIAARDRIGDLEACIDSLLATTRYPDVDIVIADCASREPATFAGWAALAARHAGRVALVESPRDADPAPALNRAAAAARGDYLLFLAVDARIVQPDWLDNLLAIATRDDVAAVGCRQVSARSGLLHEAGLALGSGTALEIASPGARFERLQAAGDFNRLQVDRNVATLSADAMLVARRDFEAASGFDAARYPTICHDLDLGLRLHASGRRLVWTPHATIVRGATESPAESSRALPAPERIRDRRQRVAALKRWLPVLADDALDGNRHLDPIANRASVPNADFAPDVAGATSGGPRIVGLAGPDASGNGFRAPLRALQAAGRARTSLHAPSSGRLPTPVELARLGTDAVLLPAPTDAATLEWLELLGDVMPHVARVVRIADPRLGAPAGADPFAHFAHQWNEGRTALGRLSRQVDRVIVGSAGLARRLKPLVADLRLVPDRLERAAWTSLARPARGAGRARIGWSGGPLHPDDIALLHALIEATGDEADWFCVGPCPAALRDAVRAEPTTSAALPRPRRLAALGLDLAVAPLAAHPFNDDASDLPIREFAALGVPVVCADSPVYRATAAHRVAGDPGAWIAAVRDRIGDRAAALAEGDALRRWMLADGWLDDHLDGWLDALAATKEETA